MKTFRSTIAFLMAVTAIGVCILFAFGIAFGTAVNAAAPDTGAACTYLDAGTNSTKACIGVTSDSRSCRKAVAITPADSDLAVPFRAIYAGGAGNIVVYFVDDAGNTAVTVVSAATQWHPIWVKRVTTATTASGLLGCVQ